MPKLLICITGSIAAIKLPLLIHKLAKKDVSCKVVISRDGLNFITPMAISTMGVNVYLDDNIDMNSYDQVMQHINLGKWADYILVCPASANSIAKLSSGYADNLLTATILASNAHKIIVPAMNKLMWKNSLTQENVSRLQHHGFTFWGPASGLQACGDDDIGRMIEVEEILEKIDNLISKEQNHQFAISNLSALFGRRVVITAGGTKEMIDPVRYISNHSSGKMAYALAQEAISLGAKVSLISASDLPPPAKSAIITVSNGADMLKAALDLAKNTDIFIGAAAVCDYTVAKYSPQKIKKSDEINLNLITIPDILKTIRTKYPDLFIVGFAAETNNLIQYARAKLINKQLNMIVANDVSNNKVFGQDTNQVTIINKDFTEFVSSKASKDIIAKFILQNISKEYFKK
ncbi:MAG: coaBC [Burkholderiales bacterium]|jgi:phosphopantothenoylcysteine decarboxylase/phosphopantothenate--cysteine ligase|nr:coaBC [Burkholderiales bacterium]